MWAFILLHFSVAILATVASSTNDVIASSNSSVSFSCTTIVTNKSICWRRQSVSTSDQLTNTHGQLYNRFRDKFSVTVGGNPVTSELTINTVQLTDTGTYTCYECFGETRYIVALTVFESQCRLALPPCLRENETFEITCSVNYTGLLSPVVRCRLPSHIDSDDVVKSENQTNTTGHVAYSGTVVATQITAEHTISCHAIWSDEASANFTLWNSESLNFEYGLQNVSIQDLQNKTICTASGVPQPTYRWIIPDKDQINSSEIRKNQYCNGSTANSQITIMCIATHGCHSANATANVSCSDTSDTITGSPTRDQVLLVTTICLIIVALIVIVFVIWRSRLHRIRASRTKQTKPDVVPAISTELSVVYAQVKPRDPRRQPAVAYSEVTPRQRRTEDSGRPSEHIPELPAKLSIIGRAAATSDDNCDDSPTYAELAVTKNRPNVRKSRSSTLQPKPNPIYADISHLPADIAAARVPLIPQRQKAAVYANYDDVNLSE